jgi:hypothetical protein
MWELWKDLFPISAGILDPDRSSFLEKVREGHSRPSGTVRFFCKVLANLISVRHFNQEVLQRAEMVQDSERCPFSDYCGAIEIL